MNRQRVLVTGAGGFIGHHLVKRLKREGCWVRGADLKRPEFEPSVADEFVCADLRQEASCQSAVAGVQVVYNLAADMGGIGFISRNFASIARNNSLINLHMLEASRSAGVERFLFSSSACVYNQSKQVDPCAAQLREEDAHPAAPEKGYGWEKLYAEQLCDYYRQEHGLNTKVVRFHNVYGPLGTYDGGREKAPAAACRKIALAAEGDRVEIWGDGQQTRSFLYIDDCVEGLLRFMACEHAGPINLGSDELVSVDELFDLVAAIAGKRIRKVHDTSCAQGVRGRNSDNRLLRSVLGWQPTTTLQEGLRPTYAWILSQVSASRDNQPASVPLPSAAGARVAEGTNTAHAERAAGESPLRILYVNVVEQHAGWGAEWFVNRGLQGLGHVTECIDYRQQRHDLAQRIAQAAAYDVLFLQRGDGVPLDLVRSLHGPRVFWASELFSRCRDQDPLLSSGLFDHVFFHSRYCRQAASEMGWLRDATSSVLLNGFDEELHKPDPAARKEIDVLFVGSLTPRRQDWLAKLGRQHTITVKSAFGQEMVQLMNRSKIVLNIHAESAHDVETRVFESLGCGACLLSSRYCRQAASEMGWLRDATSSVLLNGFDEELHKPDPAARKEIDVLFVGSLTPRRQDWLAKLGRQHTITVKSAFGQEMVQLMNRSKIVLNIHAESAHDVETRVFESLGCGACLLSERLGPDNPFGAEDLVQFDTPEEASERLEEFLRDDERRQAIAAHGRATALAGHGYTARAAEIASVMRSVVARYASGARNLKPPTAHGWTAASAHIEEYLSACERAANGNGFGAFKRDPGYCRILEHVSQAQGQQYLDVILAENRGLVDYFPQFMRNDRLGEPRVFRYGEWTFSPTTLRYIKVLVDLLREFGDLDGLRLLEIGGAYGGQCKIISDVFDFREYTLVDLPAPLKLARKYLAELGVTGVTYQTPEQILGEASQQGRDFDLVISNYALGELDDASFGAYHERVLPRCGRGYLTWNQERLPDLSRVPGATRTVAECPRTGKHNRIITWNTCRDGRTRGNTCETGTCAAGTCAAGTSKNGGAELGASEPAEQERQPTPWIDFPTAGEVRSSADVREQSVVEASLLARRT